MSSSSMPPSSPAGLPTVFDWVAMYPAMADATQFGLITMSPDDDAQGYALIMGDPVRILRAFLATIMMDRVEHHPTLPVGELVGEMTALCVDALDQALMYTQATVSEWHPRPDSES